jgi:hypothetical protein
MSSRASILRRDHFSIGRAAEYFHPSELQAQTGQPLREFWHVALKELVDNGIDAAETAGRAPNIHIEYELTDDGLALAVADNGNGLPAGVIGRILDFDTRTSDKAAYRAPSRGQQGNAIKTLLGIPVALGAPKGRLIIETQGRRHDLVVWITPAGSVEHRHTVTATECPGTCITAAMPGEDMAWRPAEWARAFALVNPHARISIFGSGIQHGESDEPEITDLSFAPTAPESWRKFGPADLTAAAWYTFEEFERLAHLKAEARPDLTARDFAREFRGQSRRIAEVAAGLPPALPEVIAHVGALTTLYRRLCEAKEPRPEILGRVGKDHLLAALDDAYGLVEERVWYRWKAATLDGAPFMVEAAIAETEREGGIHAGVNFSAPFGDPLAGTWLEVREVMTPGIVGLLGQMGIEPYHIGMKRCAAAVVHLAMPRPQSLDRGKSRLSLTAAQVAVVEDVIGRASAELDKEYRRYLKQARRGPRRAPAGGRSLPTKREVVERLLVEVYLAETEDETKHLSIRDFFYAIRRRYVTFDVRETKRGGADLDYGYFSQTIVPEARRTLRPMEMLEAADRGVLIDPWTGEETPLGDRELRDWVFPEHRYNKILVIEKTGVWRSMKERGGLGFARRHDMLIVVSEGYTTEAIRLLVAKGQSGEGYQVFIWHDADMDGYNISRTLREETKRMPEHRVEVYDLGLFLEPAIGAGYMAEAFTRRKAIPETLLPRLSEYELDAFTGEEHAVGVDKTEWRNCTRVEINAVPQNERIPYLEARLAEIPDLLPKVQPPPDVLKETAEEHASGSLETRVRQAVAERLDIEKIVERALEELKPATFEAPALERLTAASLRRWPASFWRWIVEAVASKRQQKATTDEVIEEAVDVAAHELLREGST